MSRPARKTNQAMAVPGGREVARKRERILDAAASLFAWRDISLVTMEEVAARARVAKGTLYNHFSSKDDLYFSILTARMRHLCEAIRGLLNEEEHAGTGLRKYVVHTMMFLLKYPDFFRLLRRERACPRTAAPAEVDEMRNDLRDILRSFLSRGMEDGSMRAVPLDLTTDLFLGAIEGAAVRCIEDGCAPQRGLPEAEVVFDILWRSLAAVDPDAVPKGLAGARVLITRQEEIDEGLGTEIAKLGGVAIPLPLLRTAPPEDEAPLRVCVARASQYDWILFTSARGVDAFRDAGGSDSACGGAKLGAVGEGTARRLRGSIGRCDLAAETANGAGLASRLREAAVSLAGIRVLLPRAAEARPDLPRILRSEGAEVDEVVAYRTVPADVDPRPIARAMAAGEIDAVALASGSAARAFAAQFGESLRAAGERRPRIVSIGPSTSVSLREVGINPDGEAVSPSWAELALAVLRAVRGVPHRCGMADTPGNEASPSGEKEV